MNAARNRRRKPQAHGRRLWYLRNGGKLARPKRFELLTPRFVVWCSIQLSYGRVLPSEVRLRT